MDTPTQADLRAHIRWLLRTGALPPRAAEQKLYGGRGTGQVCACCSRDVSPVDVLYEVELPEHALPLPMHLHCLEVWEDESKSAPGFLDGPPRQGIRAFKQR
jgi:hypothetical protein